MTSNLSDGCHNVVCGQVTDEKPEAISTVPVTKVVLHVTVASIPTVLKREKNKTRFKQVSRPQLRTEPFNLRRKIKFLKLTESSKF